MSIFYDTTGRLGLGAFFGVTSGLWSVSVFRPFSPQPPVTQTVGRRSQKFVQLNMFDHPVIVKSVYFGK
jgi:hypothetical protein